MGRDVVDIIPIRLSSDSQGEKELGYVESAKMEYTAPVNRVNLMNTQRSSVFQTGPEDPSATLTYVPELLLREVNWFSLWRAKESFEIVFEYGVGGLREKAQRCRVESISANASAEGDARQEVAIKIGKIVEILE